ncbi:hypothetical protein C9374_004936 [Naegleria lovaniensis]|uniref:Uncharacterized protein n=1 Tax=Naegleria lovaniensis TaxID=51637 RepID=A0AA88KIM2_NAELO|nr:uncharacterized protein C9374_004936 [Naegleria lovaniensis]KAG2382969.1 hypothetical protein C9374_004936 [Naegleria lovaniensis]
MPSSQDSEAKKSLMKVKRGTSVESSDDESYTTTSSSSLDSEIENNYAANTSTSHLTTTHRSGSALDDSGYSSNSSFTISSSTTTPYDINKGSSPKKPSSKNHTTSNNVFSSNNTLEKGQHHIHRHFHHYADSSLQSKGNDSSLTSKLNSNMDSISSSSLSSSKRGGMNSVSSSTTTTASTILNPTVPSPNVQVDLNASTTNSKAILSALQSLQDKIKTLQTKNDELEREKVEQRNRYEHEIFSMKMKLESERDSYKDQLEITRNELRKVTEKLSENEKELESTKEARRDLTLANNKSQQRTLELERKSNQLEKDLLDLRESHSRLNTLYEQSSNKIEELQSNLVKMHRRKDRAESERKELDAALKEMIDLHQQFVSQTMMNHEASHGTTMQPNAFQPIPSSSPPPHQPPLSPTGDKKKKKQSRPKSAGYLQPTLVSKKKKREIPKKGVTVSCSNPQIPQVQQQQVPNMLMSSTSGNVLSKLSANKTIHERLKKSNNNLTPPFLPNSFKSDSRTYHIAGQAQNLLSTTLGVGKKDQTNYYGANEHSQDKEHVQLIKEVDACNNGDEVKDCIVQLEAEYQQFQEQYKIYLNKMADPESNLDFIKDQLKYLTDAMERKNRQINSLKNYQVFVCERIREATSPPRIRGTEKRVQALRLFNDLRKLQQETSLANQ